MKMKVFIAVDSNKGLDSPLGNRFGRAGYFLVYDTAKDTVISVHENTFKDDAQGVGIKVANMAVDNGCGAAIGAQPGPKAANILAKAGIKMLVADSGTAGQAIERFKPELQG